MKFRKRPVVVDAKRFSADGKTLPELKAHCKALGLTLHAPGTFDDRFAFTVETLEGPMRVRDGDWIITGVQGERYPCKPDIFAATYERVRP